MKYLFIDLSIDCWKQLKTDPIGTPEKQERMKAIKIRSEIQTQIGKFLNNNKSKPNKQ